MESAIQNLVKMANPNASIEPAAAELLAQRVALFAEESMLFANKRARARIVENVVQTSSGEAESAASKAKLAAKTSDIRMYIVGQVGMDVCGFDLDELEDLRVEEFQVGANKLHSARVTARNQAIALQNIPTKQEKKKRKKFVQ